MTEIKATSTPAHSPWNKGKLVGQKPPLKLREIWTVRTRLQMAGKTRELALFNLAIDSKLRGCDLVQLRVRDVAHEAHVLSRATVGVRPQWRCLPSLALRAESGGFAAAAADVSGFFTVAFRLSLADKFNGIGAFRGRLTACCRRKVR